MRFTEVTTTADIPQTDARPRRRKTRLTRKILAAVREMIEARFPERARRG